MNGGVRDVSIDIGYSTNQELAVLQNDTDKIEDRLRTIEDSMGAFPALGPIATVLQCNFD